MLSWLVSKICGTKVCGIHLYIGCVHISAHGSMMAGLSSEPRSFNGYTDVASWLHWAARADPSYSSRAVPDVLQLLRRQFYFWWKPRQAAQNCSYQTGSPSTDYKLSLPVFIIKQMQSVLLFVVLTLNARCYCATFSLGMHRLVKQMKTIVICWFYCCKILSKVTYLNIIMGW